MFILTKLADVIQIEPGDFTKPSRQALEDNINRKYANKVVQKVGYCLCFYDLISASDGHIGHGDGIVNVNVTFRLVVFRPFKGEVIEGKIAESTSGSIRINLDFFDDVTVKSPDFLFEPSHYDAAETTWIWTNDGTPYYFDKNERVRVRIESEEWTDQAPGAPSNAKSKQQLENSAVTEREQAKGNRSPWKLSASMSAGGLGVVSWWMDVDGGEVAEDGEGEAMEEG